MLTDKAVKDLVDTSARKCAVLGNSVFLPYLRLNGTGRKLLRVTRRHLVFLNAYGNLGMSFEDAAREAKFSIESAERFWKRADVQEWLRDIAEEASVQFEWSRPSKWYAEGEKMMMKEEVPKHRLDIWREFGERSVPIPSRDAARHPPQKIEINIDPLTVQAAFDRQKAIEAEVA